MTDYYIKAPNTLQIYSLTEDLTPDTANDYLATYDASTGSNKKVLLDNLGLGGGGGGDAFTIMQPDSGTAPTADSATDTLTFTSADGSVLIAGNSTTDTLDFSLIGRGTSGNSLYIGASAGAVDDLTNNVNLGIGFESLKATTTGADNVSIGYQSMLTNITGAKNTAIGRASLYSSTGANNTAVGYSSLTFNTNGNYNTGLGVFSLYNQTGGNFNVALGYSAMYCTGSADVDNNVVIGAAAGYALNNGGDNNVLIGFQAGNSITTGGNNIIIGYDQDTPAATTSNYINIGGALFGDTSSGNIGIGTTDYGSGTGGVVGIVNATAPSGTPTGGGVLYVESGALKYKGSSGTITTLGAA